MTTIAWNQDELAVDSACEVDEIITDTGTKKMFFDVGKYQAVAIAGSLPSMLRFLEWLDGEDGECPDFEGVAIAVRGKKVFGFYSQGRGVPCPEPKIGGQGSGFKLAMGAMHAGASAREAVKIACKLDCYTGGKVNVYNIRDH